MSFCCEGGPGGCDVQDWQEQVATKWVSRISRGGVIETGGSLQPDVNQIFAFHKTSLTSVIVGAFAKYGFEGEKRFSWDWLRVRSPPLFFFYRTSFPIPWSCLLIQLLNDSSGMARSTRCPSGNLDVTACKCLQPSAKPLFIIRAQINVKNFL